MEGPTPCKKQCVDVDQPDNDCLCDDQFVDDDINTKLNEEDCVHDEAAAALNFVPPYGPTGVPPQIKVVMHVSQEYGSAKCL